VTLSAKEEYQRTSNVKTIYFRSVSDRRGLEIVFGVVQIGDFRGGNRISLI